jgi:6-phosphogluconate dehydrogenase
LISSDSEGEIRQIVDKIFDSVDHDGNGLWSFDEVQDMFQQMSYQLSVQNGQIRPSDH